ncbi:MAG: hemolysin III family protein [Limnochordia bacterium]|jgi:hemolysin III|nr:hemolysin III family protein [Limnochordia bacterium]
MKIKEPVNALTHFVMFLAGLIGLGLLLWKGWGTVSGVAVALIFGLSIIMLYGASTLYHWVRTTPKKELILRKLDHISIYVLIAGTYTPILYYGLEETWRWAMLALVWGLAAVGAILKIWLVGLPRSVTAGFYLFLGWMAVIPFKQLVGTLPKPALILLIAGGAAYTIGAIIYATKIFNFVPKRFGFHEVFHIFVGLGTILHFLMVFLFVL